MITLLSWLASIIFITCPITEQRGGRYELETKKVTICQNFEQKDNYVLYHEASHWFRFEVMTTGERAEYFKIWFKSKFYVSEYAKTKIEEDFAETSRAVLMKTYYRRTNDKLKFVKAMHKKYWFNTIQ